MGLTIGILVAVLTLPAALAASLFGPGANPGTGRSANGAGLAVLLSGEVAGALLIFSHYHPLNW